MKYNYEEFYKKYPVNQHDDPTRHGFVAGLVKGRVCDVACGTGTLSDYYPGCYHGYDIARSALEQARKIRRKDAEFFECDFTKHRDFDFGNYETIVIAEFLEHIDNDDTLFESIKKTAKGGTRLIISCPNGDRIPCDEHVRELTIPMLRAKLSPLGRVKFYNWPGAKRQIICTCDIGVKNDNDMSLVIIAKNEEKGLENCILSVMDYVDNIVVAVDNSTTDQTVKIAKRYADEVKMFNWHDDFSEARNYAHAGVKTKWIIFLDGHEYLGKFDNYEDHLEFTGDGLLCTVVMENGFTFRNPRIYKNGFKFEGAVHEKLNTHNVRLCADIQIRHDRTGSQSTAAAAMREKQRDDMVPRIMGGMLEKDKKNLRALFHLGVHYQLKKNVPLAIKYYKQYLKYSTCKDERWFVRLMLSCCHLSLRHPHRALWQAFDLEKENPGRWENEKMRAMCYFQRGEYLKAIESAIESMHENTGLFSYKPWQPDLAGAWNMIGESYFRLNDIGKAASAFYKAAERAPDKKIRDFLRKRADLMTRMLGKN